MESSFSLPFWYCHCRVSAPLSQDSPSIALSQLRGKHLPGDAMELLCLQQRQDPTGAVQAPEGGVCWYKHSRDLLSLSKPHPSRAKSSGRSSRRALLHSWQLWWPGGIMTILLHFHQPCAHTNTCLLIPAGSAAHTIASLP